MLRAFQRFRQLTRSEQDLIVMAIPTLAGTVARLKIFGFKRCYLRPALVRSTASNPSREELEAIALAVRRASNGLMIGTCLSRSLALRDLLSKKGVTTEFRIGVEKNGDGVKAHAWLEYRGSPIGESISDRYNVFAQLN